MSCANVRYEVPNIYKNIARQEVKEPEVPSGSFAHFSSYWEKWAAGGRLRPEERNFKNTKDGSPRPLLVSDYRTMLRSISAREWAPHISMVSASSAFSFSTSTAGPSSPPP